MKVLQILIGLTVAAFIIFTVVVGFSVGNADEVVKNSVESINSELTQADFSLKKVELNLNKGKGALHGMQLSNPIGFSDNDLLASGKMHITLDVSSAKKSVKVIKELHVSNIVIRHEVNAQGSSNIEQVLNNIAQQLELVSNAKNSEEGPVKKSVFLMVETLKVDESDITIVTGSESRVVTLPAYTEVNMGSTDEGLKPEQLAKVLLESLLVRVLNTN